MSSLGGGFSQIRRRSHAQSRITQLVREFQRFTASQIKIENPDFRSLNRTVASRLKYADPFVFTTRKSVLSEFIMPFEPDFNHLALMLNMNHIGRYSKDSSGFGHHGQILGVQALRQGIENGYGPSLYQDFDGETSYIQIKDRYNLLNSSNYLKGFSIACRIYPEDLQDNSFDQTKARTILSKHDDTQGLNGYVLGVLPDGSLQYTFLRNGIPYSVATPPGTIRTDTTTEVDDQILVGEETIPPPPQIPYDITVATSVNPDIVSQANLALVIDPHMASAAPNAFGDDQFGIHKLYADDPAKTSEDWFLGATNLASDPRVDLSGSVNNLGGGVYEGHVTTSDNPASFRINVRTKESQSNFSDSSQTLRGENWVRREADGYTVGPKDFRDVEMTAYWKVTNWSASDEWSPYVRGGSHHDGWKIACIATEYKGQIQKAGNSRFAKEFHHLTGNTGYAFYSASPKFQLSDRTNVWTGHKFVCYDFVRASDGKKCVMNQVWVDEAGDSNPALQNWRLMNEMVDDGTLADCPEKGYVSNCNGIAKQVFRWGSGQATFRIDNVVVQVKKASIRNILGTGGVITPPPPPPPPPPAGPVLDDNGIQHMATPKVNGRNWYLKIDSLGTLPPADGNDRVNPTGDPQIEFECASAVVINTPFKYVSLDRAQPSADLDLGAHNACRLHIMSHVRGDADESNVLYSWNDGAATHHYMVHPDDVMSAEWTLICRLSNILDFTDAISAKFGGAGHHTAPATNNQASCFNAHVQYGGANGGNAYSMEFNHGTYERYTVPTLAAYSNIDNKWFGVKVCSMPKADFSARDIIVYINADPIDIANGAPKNTGWKKYTQFTQTTYLGAPHPHVWGGAKDTWRLDLLTKCDIAYASRIEITSLETPISVTPPPPPPPPTGSDKFGVRMIYPTKGGGETWFLNAVTNATDAQSLLPAGGIVTTNPLPDILNIKSNLGIRWAVSTSSVYNTAIIVADQAELKNRKYMQDIKDWTNVEITGYFRVKHMTGATINGGEHIEMDVRRAAGNSAFPCFGTAYHLNNYPNGQIIFKKELSYESYATNNPIKELGTNNWVLGAFFGLKFVLRSTNTGTVKGEAWYDSAANNTWLKVFEFEDIGQIGGTNTTCGGSNHEIIVWGGPIAVFRWDAIDDIDVKWLSIREILPTTSTSLPIPDPSDPGGGGLPPIICPSGQSFSTELQKCVFPTEQAPPPGGHVNEFGLKCFFADPEHPRFFTHTTTQGHYGSKDDPFRYNFNLPQDVVSTEFSCLIKITTHIDEHITVKLGGGVHNSKIANDGCCYDFGIVVNGQSSNEIMKDRLLRKECPHPQFKPCSGSGGAQINPLFNLASIYNQEIGLACIKVNQATSNEVLLQVWINLTPTNLDGTIKNDTWQLYWEYTDRGTCFNPPLQIPKGPSRQDLIMVDNCFYEMRFASIREVIPISIALSPPTQCHKLPVARVTASGYESSSPPISVIDNRPNTRWANLGVGSWVQLDLGTTDNLMNVCSLDINFYQGDIRQYSFVISLSTNGQLFTDVFTGKNTKGTANYVLSRQQNTTGRFIRLTVNGNTENKWASVEEITVYGFATTDPPPVNPPICQTGYTWNEELQKCDNTPNPSATDCYPGLHYDNSQKRCVPNNILPITSVKLDMSVNNVHYIADINSTTAPIDATDETLLPSGRHFSLVSGDKQRMFRVGTLYHDPLNPLWWKWKGGIQDVRVYREYVFTSIEVANLYENKLSISAIPFGQTALVGFATYFDTQVSPGGFHINGFHAIGFHTGQTPGLNDPGQQSTE